MTKITTLIPVTGAAPKIERALQSILPLNSEVVLIDLGCRHDLSRFRDRRVSIERVALNDDFAKAKNYVLGRCKTPWVFWMEAWEELLNPSEIIACTSSPDVFRVNSIEGDVISKPVRFWAVEKRRSFCQPVFDFVQGKSVQSNVYLKGSTPTDVSELRKSVLNNWIERRPFDETARYYRSWSMLSEKNWSGFMNSSEHFLSSAKDLLPVTMTRYHRGLVLLYVFNDLKKAASHALACLAAKCDMAEFWCLLGDVYFAAKDWQRARSFYVNAKIVGERRSREDEWPLEIKKYREYPQGMIDKIDVILKKSVEIKSL